jgi:hypothetical protein
MSGDPVRIVNFPFGQFAAVLISHDAIRDPSERQALLQSAEMRLKLPVVLHDLGAGPNTASYYGGKKEWHEYLRTIRLFDLPATPMPPLQ